MTVLLIFISYLSGNISNIPSFDLAPEVMYLGVENKITLRLNNCNPEDIEIKVMPGNMFKRNDSTYIFSPQQLEDEVKMKLYYKKVICEVKMAKVKAIPEPKIGFEIENEGVIRLSDLDKLSKLSFKYDENYPKDHTSTIVSFAVYISEPNGLTLYSGTMKGDNIDNGVRAALKQVKSGSKITINNVVAQNLRTGLSRLNINYELTVTDN